MNCKVFRSRGGVELHVSGRWFVSEPLATSYDNLEFKGDSRGDVQEIR